MRRVLKDAHDRLRGLRNKFPVRWVLKDDYLCSNSFP